MLYGQGREREGDRGGDRGRVGWGREGRGREGIGEGWGGVGRGGDRGRVGWEGEGRGHTAWKWACSLAPFE